MFRLCILMSCFDSISAFCAACDHKVPEKSEKLSAVVSDAREVAALDKRVSEEITRTAICSESWIC
jgi:hypothetical protein